MEEVQEGKIAVEYNHPIYGDWQRRIGESRYSERYGFNKWKDDPNYSRWLEDVARAHMESLSEQWKEAVERSSQREEHRKRKSKLAKKIIIGAFGAALTAMAFGIPAALLGVTIGIVSSTDDVIEVWKGEKEHGKEPVGQVIEALKKFANPPRSELVRFDAFDP